MSERHSAKIDKYECLSEVISDNGWSLNFFAVEVGAGGFCASTLRRMLRSLGLNNPTVKSSKKSAKVVVDTMLVLNMVSSQ